MDCCFGRKISSLSCENFLDFLNPISNVYFFVPNVYFYLLSDARKQSTMNRNVLVWCKREGRLRKNAHNTGRYLICFFCAIFICRSGLIVVVTINQSLRFFDSYFTFNISRCSSEVS